MLLRTTEAALLVGKIAEFEGHGGLCDSPSKVYDYQRACNERNVKINRTTAAYLAIVLFIST